MNGKQARKLRQQIVNIMGDDGVDRIKGAANFDKKQASNPYKNMMRNVRRRFNDSRNNK